MHYEIQSLSWQTEWVYLIEFFIGSFYAPRLLGFSVYVSNTTDRSGGVLCFKDSNFTLNTIPAVFTTNCPVYGQYVIYYNERLPEVSYPEEYSDYVETNLCEVEVYSK